MDGLDEVGSMLRQKEESRVIPSFTLKELADFSSTVRTMVAEKVLFGVFLFIYLLAFFWQRVQIINSVSITSIGNTLKTLSVPA